MSDLSAQNIALIEELKSFGSIISPSTESAFQNIPRHLFVGRSEQKRAYTNYGVAVYSRWKKWRTTASQPSMVAEMIEELQLQSGQKVLEIGAGTGYNSALMKYIIGEEGEVVTIDFNKELTDLAVRNISKTNVSDIKVVCGDGWLGYSNLAPYDRIILTASTWDISPAWYEQIRLNGRFVLPLSIKGLQFITVVNSKGDRLEGSLNVPCGFMRMKGSFAEPFHAISLSYPENEISQLQIYGQNSVSKKEVSKIEKIINTSQGFKIFSVSEFTASWDDFINGIRLWIALKNENFCILVAPGNPWYGYSVGFWNKECICLLNPGKYPGEKTKSIQLEIMTLGKDPEGKHSHKLIEQIRTWITIGRPRSNQFKLRAYPKENSYTSFSNETVILAKYMAFVFNCP